MPRRGYRLPGSYSCTLSGGGFLAKRSRPEHMSGFAWYPCANGSSISFGRSWQSLSRASRFAATRDPASCPNLPPWRAKERRSNLAYHLHLNNLPYPTCWLPQLPCLPQLPQLPELQQLQQRRQLQQLLQLQRGDQPCEGLVREQH